MGENIGTWSHPVYRYPHPHADVENPCFRCGTNLWAKSTDYSTFCEDCIQYCESIVAGQSVITDFGGRDDW